VDSVDGRTGVVTLSDEYDALDAASTALATALAAVTAENVARTAAVSGEATTRAANDTTETTARSAGDATNAAGIASEVTARTAAVSGEATTRAANDTTETTARSAGDATNAAGIASEVTARTAAVTAEATARVSGDALAEKTANKDQPGGYPSLDGSGKVPSSELPSVTINDTYTETSQAAMLALAANVGDTCVRPDISATFILSALPASTLGNWVELLFPAPVTSVDGLTGTVSLTGSYDAHGLSAAETARAEAEEVVLAAATTAEAATRASADTTNAGAITAEAATARAAETANAGNITSEAATRLANDNTEIAARAAAITAEAASRVSGDAATLSAAEAASDAAGLAAAAIVTAEAAAANASNLTSGTIPTARFPNGAFNGISELVQLDASGHLPALNGSALTNLPTAAPWTLTARNATATAAAWEISYITTNAAFTLTMPTAPATGQVQIILNVGNAVVTIAKGATAAAVVKNNSTGATQSIKGYRSMMVVYDGTNWDFIDGWGQSNGDITGGDPQTVSVAQINGVAVSSNAATFLGYLYIGQSAASATGTLNSSTLGWVQTGSTAGQTMTLPAVTSYNIGVPLTFLNRATVSVTLAAPSTTHLWHNGVDLGTSIVVQPGQSVILIQDSIPKWRIIAWDGGDATWTNVSGGVGFTNSYADAGGAYAVSGFRKDVNGRVDFRVAVNTGASGSAMFTLPAGYRPAASEVFAGSAELAASQVVAEVTVTSAGVVTAVFTGALTGNIYVHGSFYNGA
jgi:hypothetical protein